MCVCVCVCMGGGGGGVGGGGGWQTWRTEVGRRAGGENIKDDNVKGMKITYARGGSHIDHLTMHVL